MDHDPNNLGKTANFDSIELEKENILPLKDGRSAQRLTNVLQQDSLELNSIRVAYERRLLDELEDLDDPLELFLEYITWINDMAHQGATSKQSGMLNVIERCLMYFRDMETYKNDPRLLKLWLWYIELFSPNSDQESKDIFIYMLRKRIGYKLSLFYEEFSSLLFEMRKYKEAYQIMKLGIDENARPQNRLLRRLSEIEVKLRDMNVDAHGWTIEDTHFSDTRLPAFILGSERASIISNTGEMAGTRNSQRQANDVNEQAARYRIFNDYGSPSDEVKEIQRDGWDFLDTLPNRSKENRMLTSKLAANTNLGKIQQEEEPEGVPQKSTVEKLPIFKDSLGRSDPVYKILEIPGKMPEKIDCNFDLIYPNPDEEYCIEEILAISRNMYHKKNGKPVLDCDNRKDASTKNDEHRNKRRKAALTEKTPERKLEQFEPQAQPSSQISHAGNSATASKMSILPLNDVAESENKGMVHSEKSSHTPSSPTVTYFSKDAMSEVYSMFNQNYKEANTSTENEDTKNKFALFENFTQEFTRPNMDDLTEVKSKNGDEKELPDNLSNQATNPINKPKIAEDYSRVGASLSVGNTASKGFLSSIQENSEHVISQKDQINRKDSTSRSDIDTAPSSPFLTQPQQEINANKLSLVIKSPLDERLRQQLLDSIEPPLDKYDTFFRYNQPLKMASLLQKIHRVSKSKNKNPIVDFKKTGDLYCIRAELGEGGYATVYLAESSTGKLRALKVEKPASIWEYYILKQIERRLKDQYVLRSIINASALHCFQDESYLVLNYANQGTILDLVNLQREKSNSPVDELLCMFVTIELMKVVEATHDVGIIHGDLKPDNCMVRFESGPLGPYNTEGSNGWYRKGIYLIDFGRSFDMTLLRPGSKFKADWKTDQQDCYEMRHGQPWSYEADYYGLAGIIHSMLFGQLIETVTVSNGELKLKFPFRRYWRQDIWIPVFDTLLNSGKFKNLPITSKIKAERNKIEICLKSHANDKLRDIIFDWEADLVKLSK